MKDLPLQVGVLILPEQRWSLAALQWQRAEELGFDHAWTYDHLAWKGHRDTPWFGAVPTIAAAAAATKTLRLGTLVSSANFRHPVPFAKEIVTLDDISAGRLIVGLGSGSAGWDASMLGGQPWSMRDRMGRFAEFTAFLDALLREPENSLRGRWYSAHEARTYPGCVQKPRVPFAIAASGPRAIEVAARFADIWVTTGSRTKSGPIPANEGARDVANQLRLLEQACEDLDRDPQGIRRLVVTGPTLQSGLTSREAFQEVVEAYAGIGATDLVVHWPRPDEPYRADIKTFLDIFRG